jgi:protein-S-isoprenylcysteine O-methyltransferase Ste14
MVCTGFGGASGSAAAALGVAALMGAAYSRRIASEEDMLTGKLGTAYAEYSQRTNRLIPFIW